MAWKRSPGCKCCAPTIDTCNTATWPSTLTLTWPNGATMTLTFNLFAGDWRNTSQPNYNRQNGSAYDQSGTTCTANGVAAKLQNVFLGCGGTPSRPILSYGHWAQDCGHSTDLTQWLCARNSTLHGISYNTTLVSFTNSPVNIVYHIAAPSGSVALYADYLWTMGDTITIVQ